MESRERSAAIGIVAPIVVFLFTFAVFFPTLAADLVDLDDFALLVENTKWRGMGWENIKWMFSNTLLGHYQPLTWMSYAVTFEFVGFDERDVSAYHFGSVVIHAVNAVLVYMVALRLVRAGIPDRAAFPEHRVRLAAGIGALAWAAHPLRVESVAWVTERRDVLSAMFLLLALLAYLRMVEAKDGEHRSPRGAIGGTRWVRLYLWSIGLLVLSLFSKPWGMSFFVILLVLDWYPLRRLPVNPLRGLTRPYRGVVIEKVPFVVLGVAWMVVAGMASRSAGMAMRTLEEWPLQSRIAQAAYGLVFYVWKSVVPSDLAVLYELRQGLNPLEPQYLLCYGLIAAFVVVVIVLVRRAPATAAVGVVYAAMVAPVLGFFQSGDQFVADRYSYLATMGWMVLFGVGVAKLVRWAESTKRVHASVVMGGAIAILLTFGVLTLNQSMVWRNSLALWEHAVSVGAGTPYVRVNYGLNLERKGLVHEGKLSLEEQEELFRRAIEQFEIAARERPGDGKAAYCMGNTLRRLGRYEEAERAYAQAAKVLPQAYTALVNRGNLLIKLGREEEGLACLRGAVLDIETVRTGAEARRPISGMPHLALGSALLRRGDKAGAIESFRKALKYESSREAAEKELRDLGERP
jgi:protein O-mannosyl-transferase